MKKEEEIQVSILCTVFNHEKFLRKCLDGFVNQETNFKYEVIINEDASTDNSAKIIQEYEKEYPDIIKPIYQKENQYSKKISINNTILFPKSKGKYIAFCEGDDYWNDNEKLQKQFNAMEHYPECSMCVHNTIMHDLLGRKKDMLFNSSKNQHFFEEEEVFIGWNVHTSSYLIRRKDFLPPRDYWRYWFGDYVRIVDAYSKGKIIYLPDVMSVYNYNNKEGVTFTNSALESNKIIEKIKSREEFLLKFDDETNKKYHEIILKRIRQLDFEVLLKTTNKNLTYSEYSDLKEKMIKNGLLKDFLIGKSFNQRVKLNLIYRNFFIYKLRNFRRNLNEQ